MKYRAFCAANNVVEELHSVRNNTQWTEKHFFLFILEVGLVMIQIDLMQLIFQRSQSKSISRSPSGSDSGTAKSRSGSRSRSGSAGSAKGSPASRRNGSASGSGSGGSRSEFSRFAKFYFISGIFPLQIYAYCL